MGHRGYRLGRAKGGGRVCWLSQLLPNGNETHPDLHSSMLPVIRPTHDQSDPPVTSDFACGANVVGVDQYGIPGVGVGEHHELS